MNDIDKLKAAMQQREKQQSDVDKLNAAMQQREAQSGSQETAWERARQEVEREDVALQSSGVKASMAQKFKRYRPWLLGIWGLLVFLCLITPVWFQGSIGGWIIRLFLILAASVAWSIGTALFLAIKK